MNVWTSVKVTAKGHERFGQAGVVHASDPKVPDEVIVKFDSDGALKAVPLVDLVVL